MLGENFEYLKNKNHLEGGYSNVKTNKLTISSSKDYTPFNQIQENFTIPLYNFLWKIPLKIQKNPLLLMCQYGIVNPLG